MAIVKTNPMKLRGPWTDGFVLDFHSVSATPTNDPYHPFDIKRTELGELLYRFKYAGQKDALADIVETVAAFVRSWNAGVNLIVPAPPSMKRTSQPVVEIATGLAKAIDIPLSGDAVRKVKETPPMKNVPGWYERQKLLAEAIAAGEDNVAGKRVLLLDDLTQSGATLARITQVLLEGKSAEAVLALVLTRTR